MPISFYPVIFTRTGNPNGNDFQYWAKTPIIDHYSFFSSMLHPIQAYAAYQKQKQEGTLDKILIKGLQEGTLDKILMQTINEDMFPRMKRPRRMYFRSKEKEFVFWGLALHNEDFVPETTLNSLREEWKNSLREEWKNQRCLENEVQANTAQFQNVRGFWGGFVRLTDVPKDELDELDNLIASSLIRTSTDITIDQEWKQKASDPRRPTQFVGNSQFPFAARMFQHFVMPWWNSNLNVSREPYYAKAPGSLPFLSTSTYDLSCFVSPVSTVKFKESDKTKAYLDDMEEYRRKKKKNICAYLEDDDIVEKDLIRLINSGEEELHLGPIETVSHARIIAKEIPKTNVVFINDAGGSHRDKRFHELSKKGKKCNDDNQVE